MESVLRKLKISNSVVGRDVELEQLRSILRSVQSTTTSSPTTTALTKSVISTGSTTCTDPLDYYDDIIDDSSTSNCSSNVHQRSRSVYISGISGIGKTSLVTTAFQNTTNSFFCRGKFDMMQSHRPFSALVDALNIFCTKIYVNRRRRRGGNNNEQNNHESLLMMIAHELKTAIPDESDLRMLQYLIPNLKLLLRPCSSSTTTTSREGSFLSDDDVGTVSSTTSSAGGGGGSSATIRRQQGTSSMIKQGFQRLKITLCSMIKTLLKDDEVLILFIDDLQWVDSDTMQIIESFIDQLYPKKFIFVGGYRNDEVFTTDGCSKHPLAREMWKRRHDASTTTTMIHLKPLTTNDIITFVADTLQRDEEDDVKELVNQVIYPQTKGNIFYVKEYLGYLHRNGHIYYSIQNLQWEWEDIPIILSSSDIVGVGQDSTMNLESVVQNKIKAMPPKTLHALKIASCLGSRFDLDVLDYIFKHWKQQQQAKEEEEEHAMIGLEEILWHAVDDGLLEEMTIMMSDDPFSQQDYDVSYKFTHDQVQTASFAVIGGHEEYFLVQTGKLLLELYNIKNNNASPDQSVSSYSWMLILGTDLQCRCCCHNDISSNYLQTQEECDLLAKQCYYAANELRNTSAFESAASFTRIAMKLIKMKGDDEEEDEANNDNEEETKDSDDIDEKKQDSSSSCWKRDYSFTLALHDLHAMLEFCVGNTVGCNECIMAILNNTTTMKERYNAYYVYMENLGASRKHDEAIRLGMELLRKSFPNHIYGTVPKRVTTIHMLTEVVRSISTIRKISTEELIQYRECHEESKNLYGKALLSIFVAAYFTNNREVMMFASLRSLRLSLRFGYTRVTSFAIVAYGMVCGALGNYKEAIRMGKVGIKVAKRFACPEVDTVTYLLYYFMLYHMDHKMVGFGDYLMKYHKVGLGSANVAGACMNAGAALSVYLNDGSMKLNKFIAATEKHIEETKLYRKEALLPVLTGLLQYAQNLAGRNPSGSYTSFEGDGIKDLGKLLNESDIATVRFLYFMMVNTCGYFCAWEERVREAKIGVRYASQIKPGYMIVIDQFWRCSIFLHLYVKSGYKQVSMKRLALQEYKKIQRKKKMGLENQSTFLTMLDAELAAHLYSVKKKKKYSQEDIKNLYDDGIRAAQNDGYVNFTAVMRERAGAYFLQKQKQPELAKEYLELSLKGFEEWGAKGKVKQMKDKFREVLGGPFNKEVTVLMET